MKNWYILHIYSGQEYKVENRIKKMIELGELPSVYDIKIPIKKVIKEVNKKRKEVEEKIMPGYMVIGMNIPTSSIEWRKFLNTIRTIPGISGFIGTQNGSKPTPISQEEYKNLFDVNQVANKSSILNNDAFTQGEEVRIIEGPFETFTGKIATVDENRSRLKVIVGILGRDTPVDLDFSQVEKI